METQKKQDKLAKMLSLPESTVTAARIPDPMLTDLYNRASRAEKFCKYTKGIGAALAVGSLVMGVPLAFVAGAAETEKLTGAIATGVILIFAVTPAFLIGCATLGTGVLVDGRRSIRKTVNDMAMCRLAELDRKDRGHAPAPKL